MYAYANAWVSFHIADRLHPANVQQASSVTGVETRALRLIGSQWRSKQQVSE